MYWRVAVIDPDGNTGAFTKAKKFTLLARLQVQLTGQPAHGQCRRRDRERAERQGQAGQGRRRASSGAPAIKTEDKKTDDKKGSPDLLGQAHEGRQPHGRP